MFEFKVGNVPATDTIRIQQILNELNCAKKSSLRFTKAQEVANAANSAEAMLIWVYDLPKDLQDGVTAEVVKKRPLRAYRKGGNSQRIHFIRKNGEWLVTKITQNFEHGLSDAIHVQMFLPYAAADFYNDRLALQLEAA